MRTKFLVLAVLLVVGMIASAQGTTTATQIAPEATEEPTSNVVVNLPPGAYIPGEDAGGVCRHISKEEAKRLDTSNFGGADGFVLDYEFEWIVPSEPVVMATIIELKDDTGSNLPSTAKIRLGGEIAKFGEFGGHAFVYLGCRVDQLMDAWIDWFGPYTVRQIERQARRLGLPAEAYIDYARSICKVIEDGAEDCEIEIEEG